MVSYSTGATKGPLRSQFLIGTEEVANLLKDAPSNLRIVNATWFMPNVNKNAKELHEKARLTHSTQYFDIDKIALPGSNLPHTLPTADIFIEHMKRLRIRKTDQIICYDAVGMFSVARAAWMLRYFGADNVRIMSGGLLKWEKEGRETASGPYIDGEGLEEGGDYSYFVVDASKAFIEIGEVHKVAQAIVNKTSDW